MGQPVYDIPLDFCRTTTCPAQPGPLSIAYEYQLPGISPPGRYAIELKGRSDKDEELFCFEAHFKVARGETETA